MSMKLIFIAIIIKMEKQQNYFKNYKNKVKQMLTMALLLQISNSNFTVVYDLKSDLVSFLQNSKFDINLLFPR